MDKKNIYTVIPNYPYLLSPLQRCGNILNKEKDLSKEEFEELLKEANEFLEQKKTEHKNTQS